MIVHRIVGGLLAAVLFAGVFCGCVLDKREPGDGAVTVYSGRTRAFLGPMVESFERQTGIEVTVKYGDSFGLAKRIREEGTATNADVFVSAEGASLAELSAGGFLSPLPEPVVEKVGPEYRGPDNSWAGVTGRVGSLVYDTTTVSSTNMPTSVLQLADEQWRGKFAIAPSSNAFKGFVAAATVVLGQAATEDFLNRLAANQGGIRDNASDVFNDVTAGKYQIGFVDNAAWFREYEPYRFGGTSVQPSYFAPNDVGNALNVCGVGITKKARGDKDARHFVGFLLSQETQSFFANSRFEYPLSRSAERPRSLPPLTGIGPPSYDLTTLPTPGDVNVLLNRVGLREAG